jgi:uncharacterized protein YcfJ
LRIVMSETICFGTTLATATAGDFMYLTPTLRRTLVIGGVSLIAVVGLIGWTRHDETATPAIAPATASYNAPLGNPEPVSRDPNAPVVYGPSPFGSEAVTGAPAPAPMPAPAYAASMAPRYAYAPAPVPYRRYYRDSRGRRRYVVVRRRPFSHSAAIVGGSAAGGALIGGLAGGGKGAAIGALAGGGGGLLYDRLTHKKTVVVER